MPFNHLIGNVLAKKYLTEMLTSQKIPQTLLFSGKSGIGKKLFAKAFAHQLINHKGDFPHPDLFIYEPEGKSGMHSIDSLRNLSKEAMQPPYLAQKKVFIILEANLMALPSSNALLKTFEEPLSSSCFILTTSREDQMIPTILSRALNLRFSPLLEEEIAAFLIERRSISEKEAQTLAVLSEGSFESALYLADEAKKEIVFAVASFLARRKQTSFFEIATLSKRIHEFSESLKKEHEKSLGTSKEEGNAMSLASLEKQREGKLKEMIYAFVKGILDTSFLWFRDMTYLFLKGKEAPLALSIFKEEIGRCLERGEMVSLDTIETLIAEAYLSFDRSTPLSNLFESFFLKISRV